MKRSVKITLCVMLMIILALGLFGCGGGGGDDGHTHQYSEEWSHDSEYHWYFAICEGHENEVISKGIHTDTDNNGECDTCHWDYDHTHTFVEEWTSGEKQHWHNASCGHDVTDEKQNHDDKNEDGICDTCQYVTCEHQYSSKWTQEEDKHYKKPTCGHKVENKDEGAHVDDDNDGICEICNYQSCYHDCDDTVWKTTDTHHWHDILCQHDVNCEHYALHSDSDDEDTLCDACGFDVSLHEHSDENNDGQCDTCEKQLCDHTYDEANYIFDENYHWFKANCGHDVISEKIAHTGTDSDGICDICNKLVDIEKAISIGIESAEKIVSGTILKVQNNYPDGKDKDAMEVVTTTIQYTFGKGYLYLNVHMHTTEYGGYETTTEYWYTLSKDSTTILGMMQGQNDSEPIRINEEMTADTMKGYHFDCDFANSAFTAEGVEQLIYKYFNIMVESGDNVEDVTGEPVWKINPETGKFEIRASVGLTNSMISFIIDENDIVNNVVITAENVYNDITYTITQVIGERTAESPFDADDGYITSISVKHDGKEISNGDTIVLAGGSKYYPIVTINPEDYNKSKDKVSTDSDNIIAYYNNETGEFVINAENAVGSYAITLHSAKVTISFTIQIVLPPPTSFTPTISDSSGTDTTNNKDTYTEIELVIDVLVNQNADPGFVAEIISGDGALLEYDEDGEYYLFYAEEVGQYIIQLKSTADESITRTITINVEEKPELNIAEILNGKYQYIFNGYVYAELIFYPTAEDGTEGVVWYSDLQNAKKEAGLYKYKYLNGDIELYNTQGGVYTNILLTLDSLGNIMLNSTRKLERASIEAKNVLMGKYVSYLFDKEHISYTFIPSEFEGYTSGTLVLRAVGEYASKEIEGIYTYSFNGEKLTVKNSIGVDATEKVGLSMGSDLTLKTNGFNLIRAPYDTDLLFGSDYIGINSGGSSYEISFDSENGTVTIKSTSDSGDTETGINGTYSYTFENGIISVDTDKFTFIYTGGGYLLKLTLANSVSYELTMTNVGLELENGEKDLFLNIIKNQFNIYNNEDVIYSFIFTPDSTGSATGNLVIVDNNTQKYQGSYRWVYSKTAGIAVYTEKYEHVEFTITKNGEYGLSFSAPEIGEDKALVRYTEEINTELNTGNNEITVPIIDYESAKVNLQFTADKTGTYILSCGSGEINSVVYYNGSEISLPYSFELTTGDVLELQLSTKADVYTSNEDIINLTFEREKPLDGTYVGEKNGSTVEIIITDADINGGNIVINRTTKTGTLTTFTCTYTIADGNGTLYAVDGGLVPKNTTLTFDEQGVIVSYKFGQTLYELSKQVNSAE